MLFPSLRILDGHGQLPIPFQIKNNIKHAISSGHLAPNTQLPSVRELADQLKVSANTVARAYRELQEEGLIVTYAGRGTFIADIVQNRNLDTETRATLHEVLQPAVTSARAIGYSEEQIVSAVRELLADRTIHVGLVGINHTIIAKWKQILETEFAALGIEVTAYTVSELQTDLDAALTSLSSAYYIFSLITTYAETRALFSGQKKQVVALITEVSMHTHQKLAALPRETPIGLVCEDIYVNNLMNLVAPYIEPELIARVTPEDSAGLHELLQRVDFILHTLTPKQLVTDSATDGQQLVEIEFLPNQACFQQIHQLLVKNMVPT